jgi:hypothetical protein
VVVVVVDTTNCAGHSFRKLCEVTFTQQ